LSHSANNQVRAGNNGHLARSNFAEPSLLLLRSACHVYAKLLGYERRGMDAQEELNDSMADN
jgi:hypothetical protein